MRQRTPSRCAAVMIREERLVGCNCQREIGTGSVYCFYHRLVDEYKVTDFQARNSRGSWYSAPRTEVYFRP